MGMKHTSGPWSLAPEFHGDHGQYYITDDLDGSEVASVTAWIGEHREEAEANARLIAAAPDMAVSGAFLLERLEEFERDLNDGEFFRDWAGHVAPAIANLRAAIAKATQP